ncbi:MAG: MopE-related protein [Pseudomonadota bacterium]|nr:MopE-related protein [Pseudomonadota bacterium]
MNATSCPLRIGMLTVLLLPGCLINQALYDERYAELAPEDDPVDLDVDADADGATAADDCDDADATRYPGAAERCDGVDQDCDGTPDNDATDALPWFADADGDTYGDPAVTVTACEAPADHVADATDCDDTEATVHPGGAEVPYDGLDQDCLDGDEEDVDGDGALASTTGGADCDDTDATVFPGAEETWGNGVTDNDCDGEREGVTLEYGTSAWSGWREDEDLGRRVVGLGDLDGDGLAEVGIGSEIEGTVGPDSGAIYRVDGEVGGSIEGAASLLPETVGAYFGADLDGGVDATGDGVPDLLVSATGTAAILGGAWLVDGNAWREAGSAIVSDVAVGELRATAAGTYSPSSVRFVGDVNGDGVEDIAVGDCCWAPSSGDGMFGRVAVFSADDFEGTIDDAPVLLEGPWAGAIAGFEVDGLNDQDGDGLADLLVSSSGGLVAAVVQGNMSGALRDQAMTLIYGEPASGFPIARNAGDIDADGREDAAIVGEEGTVYFYTALSGSGTRLLESPSFRFTWDQGGVYDVLPLGDLDGDDRSELFVPLAYSDTGTQRAWILLGEQVRYGTTVDATEVLFSGVSVVPAALFGYRVDLAGGDVDGDGNEDIVLGAPDYSGGVASAGGATLLPVPR